MLFNNGKDEADYLKTGELYYAELHPDFERKMYKIEKPEYKKLKLNNIPKMFVFKKLFWCCFFSIFNFSDTMILLSYWI